MCAMMPILRIDRKSRSAGSLPMVTSFLIGSAPRCLFDGAPRHWSSIETVILNHPAYRAPNTDTARVVATVRDSRQSKEANGTRDPSDLRLQPYLCPGATDV